MVTQRIANPCTPVRFRYSPPQNIRCRSTDYSNERGDTAFPGSSDTRMGEAMAEIWEILNDYHDDHLVDLKYGEERLRQLRRVFANFTEIENVTQRDLTLVLGQWKGATHNRYVAALTHFFKWCRLRELTDLRPEFQSRREASRDTVMSLGQVRRLLGAVEAAGDDWSPFCAVLVLTGQRRGEVRDLNVPDVDGDTWFIQNTKNGNPHVVHLSDTAQGWVDQWVPPSGNFNSMKLRWFKAAGVDPNRYRFHDIRRSFATHLVEDGQDPQVVDRILNHCGGARGVARVYNRAQMLPQRRAAMLRWEEMLAGNQNTLAQTRTVRTAE